EAIHRFGGKGHETARPDYLRGTGQGFRRRLENLGAHGHGGRPYPSAPGGASSPLTAPEATPSVRILEDTHHAATTRSAHGPAPGRRCPGGSPGLRPGEEGRPGQGRHQVRHEEGVAGYQFCVGRRAEDPAGRGRRIRQEDRREPPLREEGPARV